MRLEYSREWRNWGSILFLVDEMAIVDGRIQKGGRGGVKMLETLLG